MGSGTKVLGTAIAVMTLLELASGTPVAAQLFTPSSRVSGEIAAIDAKRGLVRLRVSEAPAGQAEKPPTEFMVDAKTRIVAAGAKATLNDLEIGHQATVEYTQESGKAVALSIQVIEPAAEPTP